MEFSYRLTGTGWSEARLSDGTTEATVTASYLSDALGVLLEAVGTLLEGAQEARCSWDEEPGEYRWIFVRRGDVVELRVLAFQDLWGEEPDSEGSLVFETRQGLRETATAIADGAAEVLAEHGEEGYLAKWVDAPFPSAHLDLVRQLLAQRQ